VMVKGRSLLDGCSPALVCADAQAAMRARNQAAIGTCFIQKFFLYGSGDREIAVQSLVVVLSSGYRAELGRESVIHHLNAGIGLDSQL